MIQTISVQNVNEALPIAMLMFNPEHGAASREIAPHGNRTREIEGVVVTEYNRPGEKVLFSPERDANPFFHFFESLWILNGSDDVAYLAQYNPRMVDFSDDGVMFHAAYGDRLRNTYQKDQIKEVIKVLKKDPDSRQAVASIWHPDLDLGSGSLDIPCNDLLMFKIRDGKLNLTVLNRSNDVLWGAYGANVVQFSTILEYVAANLRVPLGVYTQVSDSFHVYLDGIGGKVYSRCKDLYYDAGIIDPYATGEVEAWKLIWDDMHPEHFDTQNELWHQPDMNPEQFGWSEPTFEHVAKPMRKAWLAYKDKDKKLAINFAKDILATDWSKACVEWLERRNIS